MNVLVLNCGSSSVKFQVIDTDPQRMRRDADRRLVRGVLEPIGDRGRVTVEADRRPAVELEAPLADHRAAVELILRRIASGEAGVESIRSAADIHAVGHRVVHGGEKFRESVRIDSKVLAGVKACVDLAPLHNPANLEGIHAARELLGPRVPQVAVFDTAFHATMPEACYLYGIPYEHYLRHRIRRYGFHGTSHRYVAYRYRKMLDLERSAVHVITLHLGHGCSACAIREGRSFDTSMGFTPLEGLLMSTRAGDVDPSILEYLARKEGLTPPELDSMLNERSGLLGISGLTGDMRRLLEQAEERGKRRARLAVDVFCHRVRKYVGAYFAIPPRARAVIFTGGIGENSPLIRRRICRGLESIGLILDLRKNDELVDGRCGKISAPEASLEAYVIPTDEELLIARDTCRVIADGQGC